MRSSSGAAIPWSPRSAYIFRAPDSWLRQPNCQRWGAQNTGVGKVRSGAKAEILGAAFGGAQRCQRPCPYDYDIIYARAQAIFDEYAGEVTDEVKQWRRYWD